MIRRRKQAAWVLILVTVAIVVLAIALLPRADLAAKAHATIAGFRDAGPFAFFVAMALLPCIGFPLSAFTVVAGPVFGPTLGVPTVVLCTILATSANVALSYALARCALRPLVERVLLWFGYSLPEIKPHNAWLVVLIVRIVPGPPFFLQSYLLALARAPFGIYMVVSTVVPACYLTATIILGDALARRDPAAMALAGAIFIGASAAIYVLKRRFSPRRPPDSPPAPQHE